MDTTVTAAARPAVRRFDADAPARRPSVRAGGFARALQMLFGWLRLPSAPHALPLSDHLRRDIGLDPVPHDWESVSSSGRWP